MSSWNGVLVEARALEAAGQGEAAAVRYARAGELMARYARSAVSESVRARRLADAEKLKKLAEQLRAGGSAEDTEADGADRDVEAAVGPEEAGYFENARQLIRKAKVGWEDIAGLDEIKQFIKETFALALAKRPEGVGLPRHANLLLYGPPGTGKTLVAAAISKGLEATFFSCKVSDLLSKYFGESGKLINAVFELAARMHPSVIFLDDFESLVPDRDGRADGAERRVLAELLTSMDGFESKSDGRLVLVIAATNKPWLIDSAVLSRFGKLSYVNLPDGAARETILELLLTRRGYQVEGDLAEWAARTEGYSGRELEQIGKELIRRMISRANPDLARVAESGRVALESYELKVEAIRVADLEAALERIRPGTGGEDLERFERWGNGVS